MKDFMSRKKNQDIYNIIDVEKWQLLQDILAKISGMAIITTDYLGTPITAHSGCQRFCTLVRENAELAQYCQKCDSRGGLEASRINRPYLYLCHYNILDAAIPILVENKYIGAIMVGQVFLEPEDDANHPLEPICFPSNRKKLAKQTELYDEYYSMIPLMSLSKVKLTIDMLFHLCNYIVNEATIKNLALDMCSQMISGNTLANNTPMNISNHSIEALKGVKCNIDRAITNIYLDQHATLDLDSDKSILEPAFAYINENKNEKITLEKISSVCHISPGYFCKLFLKETGENFATYLLRVKIDSAKELLKSTDKTITEIADILSFSDSAHFIRSFRKIEGITPGRYRVFKQQTGEKDYA